jgi:MOSC domain-containing protein YiiM
MGYSNAVNDMARSGRCGFYLAVDEPGSLQAGEAFSLVPGPRQMGIPELFKAKLFKHLR